MINLRQQFEKETGLKSLLRQTDYVVWLEKKLEDVHDMCYSHDELPDGYYDTEAVRRDETLNEIIKLIEK